LINFVKKVMKKLLYILPLVLFACSSEVETVTEKPTEIVIAKKDLKADSKIRMEISGMTCEMGCVSTIRNHVTTMKGVTKFEMDFTKERPTDFSTIEFDSRVISGKDIQTEIESIAQGIYSVVETKTLPLVETPTNIDSNSEN